MHAHVDHEQVRDAEDRSWTFRLLDIVEDPETTDEERGEAFATLRRLADYRAVDRLTAMLEDRSLPIDARDAAASAVRDTDVQVPPAQIRAWWADGDEPLQRHALLCMWRDEADIVLAVAGDPQHPRQVDALNSLVRGFEEPSSVPAMLRGLDHDDAQVREMAATVLFWNEAVAGELPLIRAAHDEEADVAFEALCALEYYATRRVLRALLAMHGDLEDEDAREQAESSFEELVWIFERYAQEAVRDHADGGAMLRTWMEPIADLITWPDPEPDDEDDDADAAPRTTKDLALEPISETALVELIGDEDAGWRDKRSRLRATDWTAFDQAARDRLVPQLVGHPDPEVRAHGAAALAAWTRTADLVALLADTSFGVRRSAADHLREVPPAEAAREPLWRQVGAETGSAAGEALAAYRHHGERADVIDRLASVARDDLRDGLRAYAVDQLAELKAADAVQQLVPLLAEPPGVTWALHISLLEAIDELELPCPDLSLLEFVDDVHVMEPVFKLLARQAAAD